MKIIHLLNWKFKTIEKELEQIKKQGFDAIQINPVQPFKEEKEFKWWSSYQPLAFKIGNMFGTKEELKQLCASAKKEGIDIIVDVVLNHTANKSGSEPGIPHQSVDKILLNEKSFWKISKQVKNWDDRFETTNYSIGLPGLDLSNPYLQKIIFTFLKELKDCGVKGLRFDAAKHIGLPNDGVNFFKKAHAFMLLNNMYGYGEFLGGTNEWKDEMAKYLLVLSPNNTTLSNPKKLVTFLESHDTYLNIDDNNPNHFHTRNLTNYELTFIYRKLRLMHQNTIIYTRPLDENNPYCRNKNGLTCEKVEKLDEREFFNLLYIESNDIKEINKIKTLKRK